MGKPSVTTPKCCKYLDSNSSFQPSRHCWVRILIARVIVQMDYNNVALGLTAGVVGLRAFSRDRLIFYREASSGLNR